MAQHWGILQRLVKKLGVYDIISMNWWEEQAAIELCHFVPSLCKYGLKQLVDIDPEVDNLERANVYLGHFPSGAGYKALLHYAQGIESSRFARYDHGARENMDKYGSYDAPNYDL